MAWRFRRSFKIAPGIRINLNKKSTSVRIGPRGFGHTISSTGKRTTSVGIPALGLLYSKTTTPKASRKAPDVQNFAALADGSLPPAKPKSSIFRGIFAIVFVLFGLSFCASQFNSSSEKTINDAASASQGIARPEQQPGLIQHATNTLTPDAISTHTKPSTLMAKVMFAKSRANIRSMPSTSSKVVKTVDIGTSVTVLDRKNDWVNVSHSSDTGWILERLLSDQRPSTAQPQTRPRAAATSTPTTNFVRPNAPRRSNNGYQRGPRGGCYYYTASGNKQYVDRSLCG